MGNKQVYLCSIVDQQKAALLFDIFTIQHRGKRAKTNYIFGIYDALAIMFQPNLSEFLKVQCEMAGSRK
jgi:hypothetical protein